MIRKKISLVSLLLVISMSLLVQSNSYPTTGDVSIFNYSPLLVLQRNTDDGGFTQGVQTKFKNGTNNWYFGNLHSDSWIVSKGDYQNPKFTILQNGNVGIGTSTPSNNQGWNRVLDVSGTNHSKILATSNNSNFRVGIFSHNEEWYGGGGFIGTESNHTLFLIAGYDPKMTVLTNGNIGIGTKTPTSKLTVAGNINSREVKVSVDAGADFVFEKDYVLPSLQEVEKFVTENKHLPEIAPAKEMQKEGINLSEMNIKLLQKIEELTLYVIEQNKRIELQQKEYNNQSSEIEILKKEVESIKLLLNNK